MKDNIVVKSRGRDSYPNTIEGNRVCQECGDCCKHGRFMALNSFFSNDKVAKLPKSHPLKQKLRKLVLEKHELSWTVGFKKFDHLPKKCAFLERKRKYYYCWVHRVLGFEYKPMMCTSHFCSKGRKRLAKTDKYWAMKKNL